MLPVFAKFQHITPLLDIPFQNPSSGWTSNQQQQQLGQGQTLQRQEFAFCPPRTGQAMSLGATCDLKRHFFLCYHHSCFHTVVSAAVLPVHVRERSAGASFSFRSRDCRARFKIKFLTFLSSALNFSRSKDEFTRSSNLLIWCLRGPM